METSSSPLYHVLVCVKVELELDFEEERSMILVNFMTCYKKCTGRSGVMSRPHKCYLEVI